MRCTGLLLRSRGGSFGIEIPQWRRKRVMQGYFERVKTEVWGLKYPCGEEKVVYRVTLGWSRPRY